MPSTSIPYQVTVEPKGSVQNVKWILCDMQTSKCGGPGANPPSDYPQIDLAPKTGPYDFTVTITNPIGGIVFAPDPASPTSADNALWVAIGPKVHPGKGNNSGGQITGQALSGSQAATLTFTDKNSNPNEMYLSYALNFVDGHGAKVNSIDPDIRNGGGSITPPPPTTGYTGSEVGSYTSRGIDAASIIGLLLGVVIGFVLAGFLFRWGRSR